MSVAVCAVAPLMVTEVGTLQVAGSLAPVGALTTQLRLTAPVNPLDGITVMVAVPLEPLVATVTAPLLVSAKLGVPTLAVTTVVRVIAPETPVTVTVYTPAVVVAVVVTVSRSVPEAEATEGEARLHVAGLVAPVGPATEQLRTTVPVNPPSGVTVMVEVFPVLMPASRVTLPLLLSAKLFVPAGEPVTTA